MGRGSAVNRKVWCHYRRLLRRWHKDTIASQYPRLETLLFEWSCARRGRSKALSRSSASARFSSSVPLVPHVTGSDSFLSLSESAPECTWARPSCSLRWTGSQLSRRSRCSRRCQINTAIQILRRRKEGIHETPRTLAASL